MAELRVTSEDIERVAARLDVLGADLAEPERQLLAAVFRLAGDALAETREDAELTPFELGALEGFVVTFDRVEAPLSASFRDAFSLGLSARPPGTAGMTPGIEGTDVSTG